MGRKIKWYEATHRKGENNENEKVSGRRNIMTNLKEIKNWMENQYGIQPKWTITFDGEEYTGQMYGNAECWDCNEFYQYFLTEDALYKAYFEVPEGCEDLTDLDYDNPYRMLEEDVEYFVNFVI